MSNNKKKNNTTKKPEGRIVKAGEEIFFISSLGKKVELIPVSPYLIESVKNQAKDDWIEGYVDDDGVEYEGHGSEPSIPTYEVEVDGRAMYMEHDLSTLDDTEDEEEKKANWAAWEKYERENDEYQTLITARTARVIMRAGIKFDYPLENDAEWEETQRVIYKAKVPTEEPYRRMHYIETEIFGSQEDLVTVVMEIMAMNGVDREEVERIKADVFQGQISRHAVNPTEIKEEIPVDSE